jgi:hypothetical protein
MQAHGDLAPLGLGQARLHRCPLGTQGLGLMEDKVISARVTSHHGRKEDESQ